MLKYFAVSWCATRKRIRSIDKDIPDQSIGAKAGASAKPDKSQTHAYA